MVARGPRSPRRRAARRRADSFRRIAGANSPGRPAPEAVRSCRSTTGRATTAVPPDRGEAGRASPREVAPCWISISCLRNAVERGASDVHIKVGSPPFIRIDGRLERTDLAPVSPVETERIAFAIMPKQRAEEFIATVRGRLRVLGVGPRPLPRERDAPARLGRPRAAARAARHPVVRGARAAARRPQAHRAPARPRPRHRPDRLGQDDDARLDDRPHQRRLQPPHRDDRGPDRDPARRQGVDRQPARGRHRHRRLPLRAEAGAAPGPRRDPRRRDARRRDGEDRADRGRDRSPRVLDAAHDQRDRLDQPHHRLLPAARAAAGAHVARRRRCAAS